MMMFFAVVAAAPFVAMMFECCKNFEMVAVDMHEVLDF